jgi:peptidoglycan-associated lipoprotein
MRIKHLLIPAIAATLVLSACGGSAEPAPTPEPTGPTQAEIDAERDAAAAARAAEEARIARMEAEAAARRREEQRMMDAASQARSTLEAVVQFDYDEATITAASERLLRAKLPILRASPTIRLRLEGHADERGSTEYNLALGNRRAVAVQEFLSGFGISANVFTTTSFGEERPAVNRSDEAAWAQNRRVEFVITGGQIVTSEDN